MRLSIPEIQARAPKVGDVFIYDGNRTVVTASGVEHQYDYARNESWQEYVIAFRRITSAGKPLGIEISRFIFDADDLKDFVIIEHREREERWVPVTEYAF